MSETLPSTPDRLDFTAEPDAVRAIAADARLRHAYQHNPRFATETSRIEPLPHQRLAVYEKMLPQPRLRFLLADDAGAGKTIMSGLYIREMLSRRRLQRILIAPPAGLVGNWQRELSDLFSLDFSIVDGSDAKHENPFVGPDSDQVIISVDTLAADNAFDRLAEPNVQPYDLVIFDEAHKLAAYKRGDGSIRKTNRYKLGEAIAGVPALGDEWRLPWSTRHLLLLTATPHQGKFYPYFALWRLLEPEALASQEAFRDYPEDARERHFVRRTKEEMVDRSGEPIFPTRVSTTLEYELDAAERELYDETTDYLEEFYNRAEVLNDRAADLAKAVYQRRLASSTYALRESLKKRRDKLERLTEEIRDASGDFEEIREHISESEELSDLLDERTADEEQLALKEAGLEANEQAERDIIESVLATSPEVLVEERRVVEELIELADEIIDDRTVDESKFEVLSDFLDEEDSRGEKLLVFTEHRDTLEYLKRRLEGLGWAGRIAAIHGGMPYEERDAAVEKFRKPADDGGAQLMLATDAAGEGINLQFCWRMINWDIPWNPARLEQRMGRLHRYGQEHDPVEIYNLVAKNTREGRVQEVLLEKLEKIRDEFGSDKVFDVVGEVLEEVGADDLLSLARDGSRDPERELDDIDEDTVRQVEERRERVYEAPEDVQKHAEKFRERESIEKARHFLPAHVAEYLQRSASLVGLRIEGDVHGHFRLRAEESHALEPLWNVLEKHSEEARERMTARRPSPGEEAIWMRPGEEVFDRYTSLVEDELAEGAKAGAVFEDAEAAQPYLAFLFSARARRRADDDFARFRRPEVVRRRLFAVRASSDKDSTDLKVVDPMQWRLLRPSEKSPIVASSKLVAGAPELFEAAASVASDEVERFAEEARAELASRLEEHVDYVERGFKMEQADLVDRRSELREAVADGEPGAKGRLEQIKQKQRRLAEHRDRTIAALEREPELVEPGHIRHVASALVVPSEEEEAERRRDEKIEEIAMNCARAYEFDSGRDPKDVSTPEGARELDLPEWPGYDLHSEGPDGELRAIEVKGRKHEGRVAVSDNEHEAALNRDDFWIYVVYGCATQSPAIYPFQPDPDDFEAARYEIDPQTVREAAKPVTMSIADD
jgi:SNF2 family DNA or RNA helicase